MNMPEINVVGDVGASFEVDATFAVADVDHLTDFTKVMLTEESFDWVISGNNLSVSAIGIETTGIALSDKKVTLKGMNSLKNGVKINSFDLPNNDPAGGIHLTLNTSVTNVCASCALSSDRLPLTASPRSHRKSADRLCRLSYLYIQGLDMPWIRMREL